VGSSFIFTEDLKVILYASLMASAPMWLVVYVMMVYGLWDWGYSASLLFACTLLCGGLAGYIVTDRTELEIQTVGVVTGLVCYLLLTVIMMVYGAQGDATEETSALVGYAIGSALGTKLWELRYPLYEVGGDVEIDVE